jgi:hypothetical protein
MALLPLRQAADNVGVARQTLYRYVKTGRISATVGHDGQKLVDTAELLRVFGRLQQPVTGETGETVTGDSLRQPETASVTAASAIETARLQAELTAARGLLDMTQAELAAARNRESKLLDIVQNQTRLLEYRQQDKPASSSTWWWIVMVIVAAAAAAVVVWMPTAPVPTAPVPTAPVPTAPVPTAPVPTAPVPTAPVPTAPAVTTPTAPTTQNPPDESPGSGQQPDRP